MTTYAMNPEQTLVGWLTPRFTGRCLVTDNVPEVVGWDSTNLIVSATTIISRNDTGNPRRVADVQVDVWGRANGVGPAPINKTSALAEDIYEATLIPAGYTVAGLTASYKANRVCSLECDGFVRVPDEENASIAHFRSTVTIVYVPVDG